MQVNPPLPEMSSVAPSLRDESGVKTTGVVTKDTSLVAQEPAMTSGVLASITTFVGSTAIILKYVYGVEVGGEVVDAIVNVIMVVITGLAPLIAAKFTRERVQPVTK